MSPLSRDNAPIVGSYSVGAVLDSRAQIQLCLARPVESTGDVPPHYVKFSLDGPIAAQSREFLEHEAALLEIADHRLFVRPMALQRLADRTLLDFGPVAGVPLRSIVDHCRQGGIRLAPEDVVRVLSECLEAMDGLRPVRHDGDEVAGLLCHGWGETTLVAGPEGDVRALGLSDVVVNGARLSSWMWTALTSPEYCVPGPVVGVAADIYAAGALLFRMLTLRPLVSARRMDTTILRRMFRDVRPLPSDVFPDLAPFDPIVDRALTCDPVRRYSSVEEFLSALRALGGPPDVPGARSLASLSGEVHALGGSGPGDPASREVVGARPTEVL